MQSFETIMKTLVVYYSRTGVTREVALLLAGELSADVEEIFVGRDYSGVLGYIIAGREAGLKKTPPIGPSKLDPADYDLVVIGTPVWAFTMASPVRTYLKEHAAAIKQVAFFATLGGNGDKRTFKHLCALCGKAPLATLTLLDKDVKAHKHLPATSDFARKLAMK
jgi:flavodoxin